MKFLPILNKEKRLFLQIGAIVSALGCAAVYIWCLSDPLENNQYAFVVGNFVRFRYFIKMVYLAFFGGACVFIWKKGKKNRRNRICLTAAIGMTGYCILLYAIGYRSLGGIKELLLTLWPFLVCIMADAFIRFISFGKQTSYLIGKFFYYVILVVSIWIVEYKMAGTEFSRREPVEIVYLFITGIFAWRIMEKHYKKSGAKWNTSVSWIFPLLGFAAVFWNHKRVLEIFSGLTNPITYVYSDSPRNVNWVGYRLTLFLDAWTGDYSFIENNWISTKLYNSPLFWIKYMKGLGLFLTVLVLEVFLLYCIITIASHSVARGNPLISVLLKAIILRSILGIFADLFVITTPDIGMLLLRNPADILLVLFPIFGGINEGRE